MPRSEIEPLEPEMWFARAADLRARFNPAAGKIELEAALRRAYHLLQLTPIPLRKYMRPSIDENAFEQLLACGAFDMAALALAGEPAGLRLARAEAPHRSGP